jgi:hypothetical protein
MPETMIDPPPTNVLLFLYTNIYDIASSLNYTQQEINNYIDQIKQLQIL